MRNATERTRKTTLSSTKRRRDSFNLNPKRAKLWIFPILPRMAHVPFSPSLCVFFFSFSVVEYTLWLKHGNSCIYTFYAHTQLSYIHRDITWVSIQVKFHFYCQGCVFDSMPIKVLNSVVSELFIWFVCIENTVIPL